MTAALRIFDQTVRDGRRGRDLRVRCYAPAGEAQIACAVLSHGFGYSRLGYGFLGTALAQAGIATLHPTHAGTDADALLAYPDTRSALHAAIQQPDLWRSRAADVTAVIDALEAGALEQLRGRCDAARLGVIGHSFGAFTTLLVAGARVFVDGRPEQHEDPRPRAFVALSPPGLGERGLQPGSFAPIARPLLSMYGTRDLGPHDQPASWRGQVFDDLPAGGKIELVVDGAPHETFANLPLEEVRADPAHVALIERAAVAFFRAQLLGEAGAFAELRTLGAAYREK